MSSSKKSLKPSEAKSLMKKEQLWLPATPEKNSFQGSFYQPRTPQHKNVSITDGILHTSVQRLDTFPLKSMSNWPLSIMCKSVFLANESMELCGLSCGELCHIFVDGEEKAIFWAWPQKAAEEKIEALMTSEAMCSLSVPGTLCTLAL